MTDLGSVANLESYKELIEKFKKLDIVTKELTLFDVGTRGHFENPTTELLSFFIDDTREHGLENCFFKGIQDVFISREVSTELDDLLSVETEVSTDKGNRIDLILETNEALIIVECKIYHGQNNPFDDYLNYGKQHIKDSKQNDEKQKKLISLVICLDGRIEPSLMNKGWHGISYQELVTAIEPYLSQALLDNPYNKWSLFAREFLLHLKELDNMGEISKDEIEFLTENINDYFELSKYFYENLMPKIGEKIRVDLNNSDSLNNFECKAKYNKWNYYEPVRTFSNIHWKSRSDITFIIRADKAPVLCEIIVFVNWPSNEPINSFKLLLNNRLLKNSKNNFKKYNSSFWYISWEFNEINIKDISSKIVELMVCLNDFELNHRPLISE